jgi:type IV pilus biogenesis protein PilP
VAVLHEPAAAYDEASRPRFFRVKPIVAGACLLMTLWLARDLPFGRRLGLQRDPPAPVAARPPATPLARPDTQPAAAAPTSTPPTTPVPVPPPPAWPAMATMSPDEPAPAGTDPSRATLIDQIGALQMQLVLARLRRELAQAQAETSKLTPDVPGDGVEALLDRMEERAGLRGRSGLAVQAVFGRDGDWAARLSLPGEGARVVRVGDVLADRWRVDSIGERAVVLVALRGDARQVLRPGTGLPDLDRDEPAAPPKPAAAAPSSISGLDAAASAQSAPVIGSMLRPAPPSR